MTRLFCLLVLLFSLSGPAMGENSDFCRSSIAAETTAPVVEDAVRFHHPFPKYLGGEKQQILEPLPKSLHDAYHSGLDKILPRQAGTAFYDSMSPAARSQMLQDLGAYTKAFDAKNGTYLFDAMVREGFPAGP